MTTLSYGYPSKILQLPESVSCSWSHNLQRPPAFTTHNIYLNVANNTKNKTKMCVLYVCMSVCICSMIFCLIFCIICKKVSLVLKKYGHYLQVQRNRMEGCPLRSSYVLPRQTLDAHWRSVARPNTKLQQDPEAPRLARFIPL